MRMATAIAGITVLLGALSAPHPQAKQFFPAFVIIKNSVAGVDLRSSTVLKTLHTSGSVRLPARGGHREAQHRRQLERKPGLQQRRDWCPRVSAPQVVGPEGLPPAPRARPHPGQEGTVSRTNDRRYQRARARLKRSGDGDICWQCSGWIDMDLKGPHADSWTADHVTPLKDGGSNHGRIMPAHWKCNLARNAKPPPRQHAREW